MNFMMIKLPSHLMKLHHSLSLSCQQNWWYLIRWTVVSLCRVVYAGGTTTTSPAWRWPTRCGAVRFSQLLINTGSCFDDNFLQEKVDSHDILACSAAVALRLRFLSVYSYWCPNPTGWELRCGVSRVDTQSNRMSCSVPYVDIPIQPGEPSFFFSFLFPVYGLLGL